MLSCEGVWCLIMGGISLGHLAVPWICLGTFLDLKLRLPGAGHAPDRFCATILRILACIYPWQLNTHALINYQELVSNLSIAAVSSKRLQIGCRRDIRNLMNKKPLPET